MKNLHSYLVVGAMCAVVAMGCKKKEPAPAAGSGSATVAIGSGSGSAMMGSGSDSAMTGSGSAMTGSGSAMTGSGSGSAMSGSAAAGETAPAADAEGARKWNCKKSCKLALQCKAAPAFHNLKECEQDCTSLAKDHDGRYARGSAVSAAYYTCIDKVKDCAGIKKCDHDVEHAK
jgi:hypothetical protein